MSHADHIRGRALVYGLDTALLTTRAQLLTADGYTTDIVENLEGLRRLIREGSEYDIVVLCHTVPRREAEEVLTAFQNLGNRIPVLAMEASMTPAAFLGEVARLTSSDPLMDEG